VPTVGPSMTKTIEFPVELTPRAVVARRQAEGSCYGTCIQHPVPTRRVQAEK
jgi:hypothetical protein